MIPVGGTGCMKDVLGNGRGFCTPAGYRAQYIEELHSMAESAERLQRKIVWLRVNTGFCSRNTRCL